VRYRGIVQKYLDPHFGRIRLAQLQPQQVKAYQDELSRRGVPAASSTLHRTILSGALKQAVTFGPLPRNVVSLVKPPRDDREAKGRMLTPVQARAQLDVVRGDRLESFYLLLLTAGLRHGEALGLRWADLELDGPGSGVVHVRQQLQWPNGEATLVPLKSRKGLRSVPLPRQTVLALRQRRVVQQRERHLVGEPGHAVGVVRTVPSRAAAPASLEGNKRLFLSSETALMRVGGGAEAGTRTLTGILPLRPERSASANSATPAGGAEYTGSYGIGGIGSVL